MSLDVVVCGGHVLLPDGELLEANVGVAGGRIVTISTTELKAERTVDAKGRVLIPGIIDQHFHVFVGYPWDTFANATRAAAKGGVTTVIDMPLDQPPTLSVDLMRKKRALAERESYVDFALYGGYLPDQPDEVEALAAEGVGAFKLFTDGAAPPGMYPGVDTGQQLDAMRRIASQGRTAAVHCEDSFIIDRETARLQAMGRKDNAVMAEARPEMAELQAIRRTILLAEETGCRTTLVHVSIPEAVSEAEAARRRGVEVFVETCPHYLLLTLENLKRDARLKYNPPNRSVEKVEAMWAALARGGIHAVASDHAPLPKDSSHNIWEMAPGAGNAVETMLVVTLHEGLCRGIPLHHMINLMSANPAKIYGLYPRKGRIAVGADADLVLLDLETERTVRAEDLEMLGGKWSPFDGWKVRVGVDTVIVGGRMVVEGGRIVGQPGQGQYVPAFTEAPRSL